MEIATPLSSEIARYLDLNTAQIQLTAANMANIDTPGYRTLGMDFNSEMRKAMAEVQTDSGSEGAANLDSLATGPVVLQVDGLIVRPDGNNVSMDRESLNLAQAQLRFKTGVALLRGQYSEIMNAIHADSK